ncbi:hypothetical protein LEP1GSC049_0082 [Leptospira kirschneri serovar Cynopteri str. 3522 CT]|nr:hypothetical protein LEP1GSC044_1416 [Leptospira kirschneri serovar Grippotyphosa str. RM52]EKQ82244.1 hypothetical protein LEP1GSC064_3909 [Leptospira kirschneri serovar Grippotyphosa str. Moskva]EKR10254.1 hypothetical protein LEP1GSC122_4084 [Leptospira kirschneri serovar Valbuzzi str. 200702274]EMK18214.1 hypothetical protein LEP1GSC042_1958 [Leptospira kirschneri serovar Bim str. PUO 1247]EMN26982.1 hypothetical protein LEP1GSC065_1106 [Leptospira kirschneri serovar Sokoine str. RM1]EP
MWQFPQITSLRNRLSFLEFDFCNSSHVLRLFWIIYVISQTQDSENHLNSKWK